MIAHRRTCSLAAWLLSGVALWVGSVLRAGEAESNAPAPIDEPPITDVDRDHWSFRPLNRPELPEVSNDGWIHGPIDQFILARLEAEGLRPMPPADRVTLLRRVAFDLTGLPPSPEEVDRFAADPRPDAYERVVERLLASPAYGERWAQHWLDLARFAETDGFEHDKVRPAAWRYRDWVIDALNSDVPYDEFVRLQLAGDELHPDDPDAQVATGFVLAGPDMPDINLREERRHMLLNEITATTGAAFMGLTLGCAQCHDHKFDPISQADFYRLRAVFEPAALLDKRAQEERVVYDRGGGMPTSHVMVRGDFRRPGPAVEPAVPRVVNANAVVLPAEPPTPGTSGRRAALAAWLTTPDNPLTWRVMANRLWQLHFGRGLSSSPSDFGTAGEEPTHPELLDWLATELIARGGSLKSMHRLIVTSATYRQASRLTTPGWNDDQRAGAEVSWSAGVDADPDNELLWRAHRRRLEGEAIRDAMLAAAGTLNPKRGGPGVMAPLEPELAATLLKDQWHEHEDAAEHHRRSIYIFARRNLRYPIFEAFDRPRADSSCAQRHESTTAPQALMLLNSRLSIQAAHDLADYATRSGADPAAQVTFCFRRTLARPPSTDELSAAVAFLAEQSARLENTNAADVEPPAALADLCLALLNLNEFIYVD